VLAAARYAEAHWGELTPRHSGTKEDE